ncbi:MAG: flagellar basal body-associated FliL family protein [Deltaproteobacteria bacterium]|nr:flagellar basal body-associated FliL family protein [Deltaproteobacteria bacterium]
MAEVNEVKYSKGGGGMNLGGSIKKIIMIAVVALVLIGGGIAASMYFLHGDAEGEGGKGGGGHTPKPNIVLDERMCASEMLAYLPITPAFVVNLADGRHHLKTEISLMICEKHAPKVVEYFTQRMPLVKDMILSELQVKTAEQLRDPAEREVLRKQLEKKIESLLPTKDVEWEDRQPIKRVLMTEFIIQ